MTPEHWQHVKRVFQAAIEHEPSRRTDFVDQACVGDPDLRRRVEALLASYEQAPNFLEAPVLDGSPRAPAADLADSMVGCRIGPYQIVQEIGRGGMGTVYLARRVDHQYEKEVAIKVVKRGMDTDAILHRFQTERQILAQLDHPNITKLLDAGTTDDGRSYFIMDYVEGLPIDVYCDSHQLPIVERLTLFLSLCSAVQYAHEHRVIHRDIKPRNVLVTPEGVPKLLDFGIAKLFQTKDSSQTVGWTAMGMRAMTPEYASPEQVRGEPITPASDVYALGVLLYELLTGHRPYRLEGATPPEIERVICQEVPEKPSTVVSQHEKADHAVDDAPSTRTPDSERTMRDQRPETLRRRLAGDLDTIVLMALRKEPARRYLSVAAFSEDIRRHLAGQPVRARRDTLGYRSAKFFGRNRPATLATALALALLAFAGVRLYSPGERDAAIGHPITSVAVLPLANLSGDESEEYFADGMTDALINDLAQIKALRVISRTSVTRFKNEHRPVGEIARELKVGAVVEGSVLRAGAQVRIAVRLVDATRDRPLWSKSYDSDLSNVLALQRKIAGAIAQEVRVALTPQESVRLATIPRLRPDAYEAYLKGRYFWNKRTGDGLKKAVEHFEQAVKIDPTYARAYAWLADALAVSSNFSNIPPREAYAKAKDAAHKALELDSEMAEAHTALALASLFYDWDWASAEGHYKQAIALEPDEPRSHHAYAMGLVWVGRFDEALAEIHRARQLDPINLETNASEALILYYARRYDEAISEARKALELDPNLPLAQRFIGKASLEKGLFDDSVAAFQKGIALGGVQLLKAELGHAYAVSGQRSNALKVLSELNDLSARKYVASFDMAVVHLGLGEKDQALEWLRKSYAERERWIVTLNAAPILDPLRTDPRFAELIQSIGLWPRSQPPK